MALKIYFCDGCNESIPLKDINENRITIDAGKIFCAKCAPKKAGRDPATRSSPAFVAVLVALIGVGFGLIALVTAGQIRDVKGDVREVGREVAELRNELGALRQGAMSREDAEASRTKILEAVQGMQRELTGQSDRLKFYEGLLRTEVDGVAKRVEDGTRTELTALAKQLNDTADQWRAQTAGHEALKGSIATIESSIAQIRSELDAIRALRASGARGTNGSESAPADELPDDSSKDLLSLLKDPDPMRRFSAIIELGRFRTPAVVAALESMLSDPESYVRDGTIRALRKINSPSSIPAVIKALRDDDFFVRASARDALGTMTTMDIAFDPGAEAGERESKVREWEAWWNLNQERLLRGR